MMKENEKLFSDHTAQPIVSGLLDLRNYSLDLISAVRVDPDRELARCAAPEGLILDYFLKHKVVRRWIGTCVGHPRFSQLEDDHIVVDRNQCLKVEATNHRRRLSELKGNVFHLPPPIDGSAWASVKCFLGHNQSLVNHYIVPVRTAKHTGNRSSETPYNVIMIQLDGVSHRQFSQLFEKTMGVMRQLKRGKLLQFRHLWANGLNSPPNMLRLICGDKNCKRDLILRHFRQNGFATLWAQEYTYGKLGFPFGNRGYEFVDHILGGTYFNMWGGNIVELYNHGKGAYGCAYDEHMIDKLLGYVDKFLRLDAGDPPPSHVGGAGGAGRGHAGIVIPMTAHTSERLQAAVMDEPLARLLRRWDEDGTLATTWMIVTSDHGIHGSPVNEFWAGEYEHRNPALFLIVPEAYAADAHLMGNLKHNRDRMVTMYDLYTTMRDLATHQTLGRMTRKWYPAGWGHSLLSDRIPANRTCRGAGIPTAWCNCWVRGGTE
jgi:hypothetical protein